MKIKMQIKMSPPIGTQPSDKPYSTYVGATSFFMSKSFHYVFNFEVADENR
jgi:hypothetical protein